MIKIQDQIGAVRCNDATFLAVGNDMHRHLVRISHQDAEAVLKKFRGQYKVVVMHHSGTYISTTLSERRENEPLVDIEYR